MSKEIEYTYTTEYCAYLEKPTAVLTWNELTIECAHPFTNCSNCEHCQKIQYRGTTTYDPNDLPF